MTAPSSLPICMVSPDPSRIERLRRGLMSHPEWGVQLVYATCDSQTLLLNLHRFAHVCLVVDLDLGPAEVEHLTAALLRAGCREFLFLGDPGGDHSLPGEVLPVMAPVGSVATAVTRLVAWSHPVMGDSPQHAGNRRPVMVAVHSPKGGTGKTLLACSLATQYAAKGLRTLLVDLAMYGCVAPSLGLPRKHTGLAGVIEALELNPGLAQTPGAPAVIHENMVRFPAGDYYVDLMLAAPPLKMSKLSLEWSESIFRWLLLKAYDVIVVDSSSEIAERTAVTFRLSDFLLLTMNPELAAAWSVVAMKDLLKNLDTDGKLLVAVNRCPAGFRSRDLEDVIGYPIVCQIPDMDRPWERAVGRNLAYDFSPAGLALKRLAQRCYSVYAPSEIPAVRR